MAEAKPRSPQPGDGAGIRLAIVTAEFNTPITQAMRDLAKQRAQRLGCVLVADVEAPGVFDVPLIAKHLLARKDVDALVALGAVVTGETRHDDVVAENAARKLADLAVETGKPVGLGITGPGQTRAHALSRIDRAQWAVESIVKQFRTLRDLRRANARAR